MTKTCRPKKKLEGHIVSSLILVCNFSLIWLQKINVKVVEDNTDNPHVIFQTSAVWITQKTNSFSLYVDLFWSCPTEICRVRLEYICMYCYSASPRAEFGSEC